MDPETITLIQRAQAGDREAFHRLVALYDRRVMGVAYRLAPTVEDAEDLYQEVFMKVFKRIHTFRFESDFFTWLYRITLNTAFNLKKKAGRIRTVEPDPEWKQEYLGWIADPTATAHDSATELKTAVVRAVRKLSPKQRTVFVLKHLEDRKISEIAALLNCAEGTVKRYLFRAVEKLRGELKGYGYV
ncbi:MAG: RNA polymerase sigma factor [Fidelibacterota bacterium]